MLPQTGSLAVSLDGHAWSYIDIAFSGSFTLYLGNNGLLPRATGALAYLHHDARVLHHLVVQVETLLRVSRGRNGDVLCHLAEAHCFAVAGSGSTELAGLTVGRRLAGCGLSADVVKFYVVVVQLAGLLVEQGDGTVVQERGIGSASHIADDAVADIHKGSGGSQLLPAFFSRFTGTV